MVEQWIPARRALDIVQDAGALLGRLRSGLVKSKAAMIRSTSETRTDKEVGAGFWKIELYTDFRQDWETGDFSNYIDGEIDLQVLGLTIELSGILEMLPFEERGLLARSLSVAGDPEWITAKEARNFCYDTYNLYTSGDWIIEQARLGFLAGRAVQAEGKGDSGYGGRDWKEREWDIPIWFWVDCTQPQTSFQSWDIGRFTSEVRTPRGRGGTILSDVHFHRQTLLALLHKPAEQLAEPDEPSNDEPKRGRRPTYDWPLACTTIWGRLHRGELLPQVQADIEQALIALLTAGDKEPAESTVRPYAKMIFEEYSKP